MSETMTLPPEAAVERKCKIEEVFDASFIELLQLVPRNPYARALVLKFTKKMPGDECESFEQLKEWVELNCAKRIKKPQRSPGTVVEAGISINVDFSETEYGRADYSVKRSGNGQFNIDGGELLEMVQAAVDDGHDIEEVVEIIAGKIDDDAWDQCEPSLEDYGDYDYSEHDVNNTTNSEVNYSKSEIRSALLRFVRERDPGLAAQL